jgi:hypothetical protein
MNIDSSKLLAIETFSVFSVLPHIIWLALYGASRRWPIDPRPVLKWLRILRWVGWGIAIPLGLLGLARNQFPIYGLAMSTFSIGLSFPESWLKRRFASDLFKPR